MNEDESEFSRIVATLRVFRTVQLGKTKTGRFWALVTEEESGDRHFAAATDVHSLVEKVEDLAEKTAGKEIG